MHRSCAAVCLAVSAAATGALACPGVVPCVPSACITMHVPVPTRSPTYTVDGPVNFPAQRVTLMSQLPLNQMGGVASTTGSSLYAWTDPLTQHEYAIMGRSNGTAFIDVTNPRQPVYVANLPKLAGSADTLWREPKVYGNYAYIGVDGTTHRMQHVNLTQLRNYAGTPLTLNAGSYTGVNNIHTLAINKDSGYLYAAGSNLNSGGLHIIDVRNPGAPVAAGNTSVDGYTHETQVVTYRGPDTQHYGREIAFNSNGKLSGTDTFSIVDVTNKSAITRLSTRTYANARYIHQGWLTDDHRYFFQNDELDEGSVTPVTNTHLWDVSDLDNPIYRGEFRNTTTSTDHNLYVRAGYVFQSNYTTGLRILKIGNLQSDNPQDWLQEVAWFDTYPADDHSQTPWSGAWNNYPYLPSGNILVSDINGGLFVLRPDLPGWEAAFGDSFKKDFSNGTNLNTVPEPATSLVTATLMMLALQRRR